MANLQEMQTVGQPHIRKDARAKAMGKAIYTADMRMPNMLVGKALRSSYPHAKIVLIDTSAAKKMPGVHCVITAQNLPGTNCFGLSIKDQEILASKKVRMMGDALALVAAENEEIAQDALLAIKVEYEELPGVFSIEDALADGAPLVHPDVAGNVLQHTKVRKGNFEQGFLDSAYIVENIYMTQRVEHMYIEPETSLAHLDEQGVMNIYTSTQYPFRDRRQIAPALNMPHNMVRVKQMVTGGGFGGKDDVTTEIQAGLLAKATNRPVRVIWGREESMICSTKRHPMKLHVKHGCNKEGKLQAVWGEIYSDKGAYASIGHFITKKAGLHLAGPYFVPNVHVDTYALYTNNTVCGAFRGFGILQASFAHESQMDQLAEKAGMSPLEIRLKNALKVGLSTATNQVFKESVGFEQTLLAAQKYMQETPL